MIQNDKDNLHLEEKSDIYRWSLKMQCTISLFPCLFDLEIGNFLEYLEHRAIACCLENQILHSEHLLLKLHLFGLQTYHKFLRSSDL